MRIPKGGPHLFAVLLLGVLVFGAYLVFLYGQLEHAFTQQEQFVPTRIYSDVWHLTPAQPRSAIEPRLKALGYALQSDKSEESEIRFTLHEVDYPTYLIPDSSPTSDAAGGNIVLKFDGAEPGSLLQSITWGSKELPDLYLEPQLIATLAKGTKEIREIVQFADIPAAMWKAVISIEDQHFLEHPGLDPRGLLRALWVDLKTFSFAQGGSTITAQLVKNLLARRSKNIFRKLNELFLALLLEFKYDKEQILERYLNEVYLGQVGFLEIHGVSEGAQHFFGKKLEDLNLAEMALMAGLIRNPFYYSPYHDWNRAIERQHLVLKKMVETGQIAQEDAAAALKQPIRLAPPESSSSKAPFFTDYVKAELIRFYKDKLSEQEINAAGLRVYTTLDLPTNMLAQQAVSAGIDSIEKSLTLPKGKLEGALAAVDQSTGYVRALVGGRNYAQSGFNRILNMKRQVGSTFKPVVYLTAIMKGEDPSGAPYSPGHPALDAKWKLTFDHGRQTWIPRNYEPEFEGWITFRKALAHSINTVAARLGVEVGLDSVVATARQLGIESELPAVPSLALGVAELYPLELLKMYSTLANHGSQDDLTVIRGITGSIPARFVYHPRVAVPAGAADLLTDMLTTVFVDGTAEGAARLGFTRPAAGKTGTTSAHRDAWFAGFTPQLTAVVWVGNDMDNPKTQGQGKLTGANSALAVWVRFMNGALAPEPPALFGVSGLLTSIRTDLHTGMTATPDCPELQVGVEKFWIDHQPKTATCAPDWPAD